LKLTTVVESFLKTTKSLIYNRIWRIIPCHSRENNG